MLELNESSYFSLVDIKTAVKRLFEIIFHDVFSPIRLTSSSLFFDFSQKLYGFENGIRKYQKIDANPTEIQTVSFGGSIIFAEGIFSLGD